MTRDQLEAAIRRELTSVAAVCVEVGTWPDITQRMNDVTDTLLTAADHYAAATFRTDEGLAAQRRAELTGGQP